MHQDIQTSADGSEATLDAGRILLSKQRGYRSFWVGSDTTSAVIDYLIEERADEDEAALFVTMHGTRITTSAINAAVAKWCKSAGVEPIGCFR